MLLPCYAPNTAATARHLGMLKEFSDKCIDTDVYFFISDNNGSRAVNMPHIRYHYLWNNLLIRYPSLQNIIYLMVLPLIIARKIKKGDIVYIYGCDHIVSKLTKINGIRIFQERTEHPDVSMLRFVNIKKYLESCKKLTGLFVISHNLKNFYCSHGITPDKIHVINMTVDASRFEKLIKQPTERYIAYCGTATNNKDGVDQLIKAFAIVVKTIPSLKLYIIGTSPKKSEVSGNLNLVNRLGITDNVVFTGVISSNNIPQLLKNAEVLVLDRPNNKQAEFGFPTKLGEYLLTGNPVVVTRVGDIPLYLKDGKNALLAEPNSPNDFANKIIWTLMHKSESEKIGAAGRKLALETFNSTIETNKIINCIFNDSNE